MNKQEVCYRAGSFLRKAAKLVGLLPSGNMDKLRVEDTQKLGELVRTVRKSQKLTQDDLALTSGANRRFIIELEQGKPTAQIGKVLTVLQTLGIRMELILPPAIEVHR